MQARKLRVEQPEFVYLEAELRGLLVDSRLVLRQGGVVFEGVLVFVAVEQRHYLPESAHRRLAHGRHHGGDHRVSLVSGGFGGGLYPLYGRFFDARGVVQREGYRSLGYSEPVGEFPYRNVRRGFCDEICHMDAECGFFFGASIQKGRFFASICLYPSGVKLFNNIFGQDSCHAARTVLESP